MLAGTEEIVQKDGINFRSLTYVAPELYGRGEQRVQIRYMPHDDRTVERCINKIKQWRGLATVRQARHHLPRGSPHCGDTTSEDLLHPLHRRARTSVRALQRHPLLCGRTRPIGAYPGSRVGDEWETSGR
ncbi:Mu transposase C-terminal domain-containing protein [Streptomyces sp. NPDC047141]|uniref:Mu transposase C-terminal domain-containing protein n=1 Tax=Streptomyces sp. NPDC047141 TaxID=3155738 RepID=UPI0033F712EB